MPNSRRVDVCAALTGAALVLAACSPVSVAEVASDVGGADDRPVVLATFTVLADMASVVAGSDARVTSITGPGTEIHGYEPTPDDLRRAAGADLLLANGLGLEAWLEGLVAPLDLPTVVVTEAVDPLPITPDGTALGGVASGAGPDDPHAWMSPRTGQLYVEAIADALAELDPGAAREYHGRAARYAAELEELHTELVQRLAGLPPRHRVLVTCEGAFSYLARDAGLTTAYLWPVNAEQQATPRRVGAVITAARAAEVPAVFCESTVSAAAQHQVARESGARFGGTLYVDSLSLADGPVPTYLDLLRHDVDVITAGLAGEA